MEKGLRLYRKAMDRLGAVIVALAALVLGLDVLSIFLEAVGRYAVGSSRAFMEEFPRLLVPFVVFLMMGPLLRFGRHVSVDILPERLKGKSRAFLLVVVYGIVLAVSIQFLIAGILAVRYYHQMGFETQTEVIIPVWLTYLPFPAGFGFLGLFAIEQIWAELLNIVGLGGGGAS